MAQRIDGKAVAQRMREEMALQIQDMQDKGIFPGLAVVLVGEDNASQVYVKNKEKACHDAGIESEAYTLPEDATQEEILKLIGELNNRSDIDGILIQLPLPKQVDKDTILMAISPDKDVDGVNPINVGKAQLGEKSFLPATAYGIVELMKQYEIPIAGKHCVIVGRSNIVGKPLAILMLQENATVTICHSRTENLAELCKQADILVGAVGKAGFITADMVKEGAVVIDAGINRDAAGKMCGDVAYDEVAEKASYITPVPGGVGPMTITMLLRNTIDSANRWNRDAE